MASGYILRQRAIAPVLSAGIITAFVLKPQTFAHAESPEQDAAAPSIPKRKSFYDDEAQLPSNTTNPDASNCASAAQPPERNTSSNPTPTDRLASQIARSRLALHTQASRLEDSFNGLATRAFKAEHNFTSTIASLAPARVSGETVLPGAIYVLVAAMSTSILVRNRNILFRATLPLAVGIGAANYLLPVTSQNVGNLVWRYEQRWPALAEAHVQTRDRVERFVRTGIEHSKMGKDLLEDRIGEVRKDIEGWVSKG